MFTLFHFGFELIKMAIQAAVYSFIIYSLVFIYTEINKSSRLKQFKFAGIFLSTYGLLFVFSFTYYGNHGLGDEALIPLGHWETMNSGDGYAYFTASGTSEQLAVDSFLVKNDTLCAASAKVFFIYPLQSGVMKKFGSKYLYNKYALAHHLPQAHQLKTLWVQYHEYWSGWRFWMLP
ncbi:MAG TPA: hypothetical protein VK668_01230 [Mucilaginibacter sp.]|nr:hypothetical protein [Mucilaginibacter sp.]